VCGANLNGTRGRTSGSRGCSRTASLPRTSSQSVIHNDHRALTRGLPVDAWMHGRINWNEDERLAVLYGIERLVMDLEQGS
jgi:hypothetical protein